jgi:hypothetical protein
VGGFTITDLLFLEGELRYGDCRNGIITEMLRESSVFLVLFRLFVAIGELLILLMIVITADILNLLIRQPRRLRFFIHSCLAYYEVVLFSEINLILFLLDETVYSGWGSHQRNTFRLI